MEIGILPRRKIRHTSMDRRQPLENEIPAESHRVIPETEEDEQVPGGRGEAEDAVVALDREPGGVPPGAIV